MSQNIFKNYQPGAHTPVLDGVRGLAVSLVLAFHFFNLKIGWLGVDLFFVLSGFLITGILIDAKGHRNFFKNFYAKRTLRIFPLYYFVLFIFLILVAAKGDELGLINPGYFLQHMMWFVTYTQNWLFGFKDWPQDNVLNHFWSLAVEEQFYLFWPLLVYITPTRKLIYLALSFIVIAVSSRYLTYYLGYTHTPLQYLNTVCRFDCLSIGASIAILIRTNPSRLAWTIKILFVILIPLAILICYKAHTFWFYNYYYLTIGFTLFDLLWGVFLAITLTDWIPLLNRFLSSGIMKWIGKYSYGIYVYHWIIYTWAFLSVKPLLITYLPVMPVEVSYGIACLAGTLVVSKISFDYFESPLLKLKRKFEN